MLEGTIPAGEAQLGVKLRYGDEMVTILTLDEPLELTCSPSSSEGEILCSSEDEVLYILSGDPP